MKITLNIEKRFAYVIIGVLIVVLGTLIVYSYGGTQPAVAGHTWGEIVCDDNMCVDVNNGRVGIGTNTPNNLLTVGTENNPFGVSSAGDIIVTGGTDNRWALYKPDGTEKFVIDSSGNINLFGPRLDVNGNIHATGDICTDQGGGNCLSSTSGGGGSVPSDYFFIKTNNGNLGFYLKKDISQKTIENTAVSGVEGECTNYRSYCDFKVVDGVIYLRARQVSYSVHPAQTCDSGWVAGTYARCCGATGCTWEGYPGKLTECYLSFGKVKGVFHNLFYCTKSGSLDLGS